jgi:hypothetical protein
MDQGAGPLGHEIAAARQEGHCPGFVEVREHLLHGDRPAPDRQGFLRKQRRGQAQADDNHKQAHFRNPFLPRSDLLRFNTGVIRPAINSR